MRYANVSHEPLESERENRHLISFNKQYSPGTRGPVKYWNTCDEVLLYQLAPWREIMTLPAQLNHLVQAQVTKPCTMLIKSEILSGTSQL